MLIKNNILYRFSVSNLIFSIQKCKQESAKGFFSKNFGSNEKKKYFVPIFGIIYNIFGIDMPTGN